ncbi:hypothetical protein BKA67DRAFT_538449 [Truncatella angustata]|uniref:Uncharacterized protein n=1 Tax=Truncatella angustata TaxID=152316 RepID=A0A9P8ZSJ9_9PEZI|nr:uncharacterized protein BKA67DRAFT_538449 [Truncatella angustata]KAH6648410.1 hypothetical protein BKA67DRAFT_538449 [Truncatella angustata]
MNITTSFLFSVPIELGNTFGNDSIASSMPTSATFERPYSSISTVTIRPTTTQTITVFVTEIPIFNPTTINSNLITTTQLYEIITVVETMTVEDRRSLMTTSTPSPNVATTTITSDAMPKSQNFTIIPLRSGLEGEGGQTPIPATSTMATTPTSTEVTSPGTIPAVSPVTLSETSTIAMTMPSSGFTTLSTSLSHSSGYRLSTTTTTDAPAPLVNPQGPTTVRTSLSEHIPSPSSGGMNAGAPLLNPSPDHSGTMSLLSMSSKSEPIKSAFSPTALEVIPIHSSFLKNIHVSSDSRIIKRQTSLIEPATPDIPHWLPTTFRTSTRMS